MWSFWFSKCDNEANYVENLIPKWKEHIDRMAVKIKDFINVRFIHLINKLLYAFVVNSSVILISLYCQL